MSTKVDKLFKDKLEGHSLQPSAQAWEKVEAHLAKKNKMVVWLRVAAAVALLGVLTFVGLKWNDAEPKQELVKKDPVVEPKQQIRKEDGDIKEEEIKKAETPKKKIEKKEKKSVEPAMPVIEEPVVQEQVAVAEEPRISNPEPRTPNLEPRISNPEPQKGITLTYTLPQPEKGMKLTYSLPAIKKDEPKETMIAEETKKKGFDRVLEIAMEVKNGDPLGELREAKDDILALDFRKDKNKKH